MWIGVAEAKGKNLEQFQKHIFYYSNMKTNWADSWPVITQLFYFDLWVIKLRSA